MSAVQGRPTPTLQTLQTLLKEPTSSPALWVSYEDIEALAQVVEDVCDEVAGLTLGPTTTAAAAALPGAQLARAIEATGRDAAGRQANVVEHLRDAVRALRRAGSTYPQADR